MSEAALLIDPLSARIEVIDAKAHPVETAREQGIVDDKPGGLRSVPSAEEMRPPKPDSVIDRLVLAIELIEDCLTQKRVVFGPDNRPVRPIVMLLSAHEPRLDAGPVERRVRSGEPGDVGISHCCEVIVYNGQRQGLQTNQLARQYRLISEQVGGAHERHPTRRQPSGQEAQL